jgi:nucleoside phosphorylase
LPKEYAAVKILMEVLNDNCNIQDDSGADQRYCLGEIPSRKGSKHKIFLAMVGIGNNNAATRASILLTYFPYVKSIIIRLSQNNN